MTTVIKANCKLISNFVIHIAKWQIWKHRNNVKYGKFQRRSANDIFLDIKTACEFQVQLVKQSYQYKTLDPELQELLNILILN